MNKVVVVGGDAAGMSAAAQASRGKEPTQLLVFEKTGYASVAAAGLPYFISGEVNDSEGLIARTPEQHRANGIDLRVNHEVVSIDADTRTVEVRDIDRGVTFTESFDQLVLAMGASPIRPSWEGAGAAGVFVVRSIPDAEAINQLITEHSPRRAVVIGAGYIGVEMAEAFIECGLEVTVVERLDTPMASLDPDMGKRVAGALDQLGVELRLGVSVEGFEVAPDGRVSAVVVDRESVAADLVVLALGVRPNVELLTGSPVAVGATGAIATDARMSTNVDGIWAAGDCAESLHRVSGQPTWVTLGTHANKHGRVVGLNVSGTHARFPGVIGTAVTKIGSTEAGLTGLNSAAAVRAGFDVVARAIESETRADYYPGSAPIAVKIIAERSTGRMLGGQIVGGPGSAKRIDAIAVAVWNEMTVEEFSQLDLGYAPPLSPVWDPTLIAARITAAGR